MFLSIIIPIYNKEKYLMECLESVLKQDISTREYEIICVNDGSTDNSVGILEKYKKYSSNFSVYNKENGGVSSARNLGLQYAKGDYIWFVDPDDFIAENCLAEIMKKCYNENLELLIVGSFCFTNTLSMSDLVKLKEGGNSRDHIDHGAIGNKIIKTDLIREKGVLFDENMTYAEDALFLHQIGYNPNSPYYSSAVYLYRLNEQSVTNDISQNAIIARVNSYIRFTEILDDETRKNESEYLENKKLYMLSMALFYIVDLPYGKRRQKIKELQDKALFPYKRRKDATVSQLYQTLRTDAVGQFFNYISVHATTPFGYTRLFLMKKIIRLKHKIENDG